MYIKKTKVFPTTTEYWEVLGVPLKFYSERLFFYSLNDAKAYVIYMKKIIKKYK